MGIHGADCWGVFSPLHAGEKPSKFVAPSPTNGNVITITTPLMVQSISGHITSFLTFKEPSPHICGDGAGAVFQFHHTEAFLPFSRASTTPYQGSGDLVEFQVQASTVPFSAQFLPLVLFGAILGYQLIVERWVICPVCFPCRKPRPAQKSKHG